MVEQFLKSKRPCKFGALATLVLRHAPFEVGGVPGVIFPVIGLEDVNEVGCHGIFGFVPV